MSTSYPVPHEDRILRLLARLYALRNDHICRRFYAESSIEHVREITAQLTRRGYLKADIQPKKTAVGRSPTYFRLTTRALEYLAASGADVQVPKRGSDPAPGFLFLDHLFSVNDVCIALELFAERTPGVRLGRFFHDQQLRRAPDTVTTKDGTVRYSPDGWFEVFTGERPHCIALEVDRGTEEQKSWRQKVRKIIAWGRGPYPQRFSPEYLAVAVVVTSGAHGDISPAARTRRLRELVHWTELELRLSAVPDEFEMFLFTDQDPAARDPYGFFAEPLWLELFTHTACPLIVGVERPAP
jgi:hypothetical protein